MRRVYLLFFVVMMSAASAMAQKGSYFSGIKAGANFYTTDVKTDAGFSKKMKPGVNAGIFFHFPVTSVFSVQPEFLYSSMGQELSGNNTKTTNKFQYLNVPVMLQANSAKGFYGETGPQFGVLIKGTSTIDNNGTTSELDLKKQVTGAALWWGVGAGYRMKSWGLNARYNFGISDISKDEETTEKLSGFEVSLSWWFKQDK